MTSKHCLLLAGLCGILVLVFGRSCCSTDPGGRIGISGTVRYDGLPLESGTIQLTPDENTVGPAAAARIEGGQYRILSMDGLLPGVYSVRFTRGAADGQPVGRMRRTVNFQNQPETIDWPEPQVIGSGRNAVVLDFDLPPAME